MDCTSQVNCKSFELEFNCARTEVDAIVNNVIAPYFTSLWSADLKVANFISLQAASLACAARLANAVRSLGAALRASQ